MTYERCWHLDQEGDQQDLAWVLCDVLQPLVVHLGVPCTNMCLVGPRQLTEATRMQNQFSFVVMLHQESRVWS